MKTLSRLAVTRYVALIFKAPNVTQILTRTHTMRYGAVTYPVAICFLDSGAPGPPTTRSLHKTRLKISSYHTMERII